MNDKHRFQESTIEKIRATITIVHPLGLFMKFSATHHNAMALVAFGMECIKDLEAQAATDDWSV